MTSNVTWNECEAEWHAVQSALLKLQEAVETAPKEDWRASLLWEAAERAYDCFMAGLFDACETPHKPENFRHWRERYVTSEEEIQ